jgi:hypothetical protein
MFLNIKYCPLCAKIELNLALAFIWHTNIYKKHQNNGIIEKEHVNKVPTN